MDSDERKLVEDARRGDPGAFRALVIQHQRKAYAVALGMVHQPDDARDICQEAFVKAHRNLAGFEGNAQFFTWLYRIIMNLCIDLLRKRRGENVEFDDTRAHEGIDEGGIAPRRTGFDPARALSDKELRDKLQTALQELSPSHRSVLLMREVEGMSYQEMADVMECSIGTIMSRLFHARKRMQTLLIDYRRATDSAA